MTFLSLSTMLLYPTTREEEIWQNVLILFCFFLPFLIALSTFFIKNKWIRPKKEVVFDRFLPYTQDNLLEAYILLTAHILKSDRGSSKEKLHYIHKYFKKNFPDSYYNFRETLTEAYQNPIKIKSITSWIRAFMRSKADRTQIIYFLAGLCIIDGRFSALEIQRLEEIALRIKLTPREFDSIIAMYKSNNQSYQNSRSNQYRSNTNNKNRSSNQKRSNYSKPKVSKKSINCKILGVSTSASMTEVKKAYRKLVKIHHPDRFHNASEEQQRIAKAKFIKIQQAYEYLEMIGMK